MQLEIIGAEPKSEAGKALYKEVIARPRRKVLSGPAKGRTVHLAKYRNGAYEWWPVVDGEVVTSGRPLVLTAKEMNESVGVEVE